MSVKLLTEHHLEFLSLKGGCTGSSESTFVKMPHCWKSHVMAQINSLSRLSTYTIPILILWNSLLDNRGSWCHYGALSLSKAERFKQQVALATKFPIFLHIKIQCSKPLVSVALGNLHFDIRVQWESRPTLLILKE